MNASLTMLLLFVAVTLSDQSDDGRPQLPTPSTNGQQTAIGDRDNSISGTTSRGRILSRRETRLETRITREKLTAFGQGNEATVTHRDPKDTIGRRLN